MKTAPCVVSVKYVLIESLIACQCLMRIRPGDWCNFISICVRETLGYCPDMVETASESKHGPTAVHSDSGDLHTSKANINFLAEKMQANSAVSGYLNWELISVSWTDSLNGTRKVQFLWRHLYLHILERSSRRFYPCVAAWVVCKLIIDLLIKTSATNQTEEKK